MDNKKPESREELLTQHKRYGIVIIDRLEQKEKTINFTEDFLTYARDEAFNSIIKENLEKFKKLI